MTGTDDKEIACQGARLTYTCAGPRSSTPVCFLPGWCGDRGLWHHQMEVFSAEHFVLALDFPGFGDSSLGLDQPISFAELTDLVAVVLHEERLSDCILVGHSAGGALALATAASHPSLITAVVGADAFTYVDFYPKVESEIIAEILAPLRADFDATVRDIAESYFLESSDPVLKSEIIDAMANSDARNAIAILGEFLGWDMLADLDRYTGPVHAIPASNTLDQNAISRICGNRLQIQSIKESGHFVMLEQPRTFNAALLRIIADSV